MIRHPDFKLYPGIPKNLKALVFGGSATTIDQYLEFLKTFPNSFVYNIYGSTEMHGAHALYSRKSPRDLELLRQKPNSVGLPMRFTYSKVSKL